MNGCIEIAHIGELPKNGMKLIKVGGFEILIVNADGVFYAFDNRCPHMGYPLFFGRLEGHMLTCGFHYAKFDVKSGKPLNKVTEKSLRKMSLKKTGSSLIIYFPHIGYKPP
ncbi:MAG: Rieske 2Fe-2S domain-containing protein [Candidatus Bathyarchaeota archaeon]|nr:Rieske 2Fe-2S domain-containing protein [Candidatus Bathyarchaeota archaeon]